MINIISLKKRYEKFNYIKKSDYWSTVLLFDWLSILIVEFVLKFLRGKIFPDHLTAASLLFFSSGIACLYVFDANYVAAFLFYVSIAMDCADGKLARAIGLKSRHGGYVDALADCFNQGIGFVLIGLWLIKFHENYLTATVIFVFSMYVVMAHINNIQVMLGNKEKNTNNKVNNHSGVNPVLRNPISVVEMSFLVIPFGATLFPGEYYLVPIGFLLFIGGVVFGGGKKNEVDD